MLAAAIVLVRPEISVPALSEFVGRSDAPVVSGPLFPFLFVTIACGALSGFHALISSGTTPKLIEKERQARFIGYGGMLMESFVAMMAMIAAASIDPGVYFAMNSPAAIISRDPVQAASVITGWGFPVAAETLTGVAREIGETSILSRAGGAPTLAVGMAEIFSRVFGNRAMMGFWYHFAILFEALFILTAVDAGTRVARFMIQDLAGAVVPSFRDTKNWLNNVVGSLLAVGLWGYVLYGGVVDPLGGINSLWPLFGISNQMLAGVALILATVVLIKTARAKYAWVTATPAAWLLVCTLTAGGLKVFSPVPAVGFLAHASRFAEALRQQQVLAPAQNLRQMEQIVWNDRLNAFLAACFIVVVITVLISGIITVRRALRADAVAVPENA
jgi:carbon starvation protein